MMAGGVDIASEDFWRLDHATRLPFREWHHFIVLIEGLELLINFNVDHLPGADPIAAGRVSRVIVMAHSDRWHGMVDSIAKTQTWFSPDGHRCRLGEHSLEIGPQGYSLRVVAPDRGIEIELYFEPRSLPMIAPAQGVGGARKLSWFVIPRGVVRGVVVLGEQRFELHSALAYHDHNWGHFFWGDDFAWEWGIALPNEAEVSDALVLSSLQNRARSELSLEQLFLWREGHNLLSVSGSELSVSARGPARGIEAWVLPAVMSLLRGRADADLPERLELRVRGERAQLDIQFCLESVAELVIPSDIDPLGVISIHECVGAVRFEGTIAGHGPTCWEGRGVFEFLRA